MNLSEIIKRVQRQFGDDVQAQITKEDIVRWANDACLEIVSQNDTAEGYLGNTQVLEGVNVYDLPPDLIRIRSVRVNGRKLNPSTYEQLCELDPNIEKTIGTPASYWVYGNALKLYPIPNAALGNVDILYIKSPALLTITSLEQIPDVPLQYHPRIVEYCIAQAAELDDNIAHYQLKMGQFKSSISELRQNGEQPESASYYPTITYIPE
jgi:hypothetical protein